MRPGGGMTGGGPEYWFTVQPAGKASLFWCFRAQSWSSRAESCREELNEVWSGSIHIGELVPWGRLCTSHSAPGEDIGGQLSAVAMPAKRAAAPRPGRTSLVAVRWQVLQTLPAISTLKVCQSAKSRPTKKYGEILLKPLSRVPGSEC